MRRTQVEGQERIWWYRDGELEPVMGVPTVTVVPLPLIDAAGDESAPEAEDET